MLKKYLDSNAQQILKNRFSFFITTLLFFSYTYSSPAFSQNNNHQQKTSFKLQKGTEFFVGNITGISGKDVLVRVGLPRNISILDTKKTYLQVLGMPEGLRFSKGANINNAWFISIKDISKLSLQSPKDFNGQFSLNFLIIQQSENSNISIIDKKTIKVKFRTSQKLKKASTRAKPKLSLQEETILLTRGQELLNLGSIATARTIFEELAQKGSAKGAYSLAQTYDPAILQFFPFSAIKPDFEKTKKWYKRAKELGSKKAIVRLKKIEDAQKTTN